MPENPNTPTAFAEVLAALADEEINRSMAAPRRLAEAVEKHKGATRLLRVEDLPTDRAALLARLPELLAASQEGRLLEGPIVDSNVARRLVAQLVEDGAPTIDEAEVERWTFTERNLRAPEVTAALQAGTFKPKHGNGKSVAELQAADREADAAALQAAGVTKRVVYESELVRLPFAVREQLRGEVGRGTAEIRPGARPVEET